MADRMIDQALFLLPALMDSKPARVMLEAIQRQEDPEKRRRQWPTGPARGLWQFEPIGVQDVLERATSRDLARWLCLQRNVEPTIATVHAALQFDDVLAAGVARLALWNDPRALPRVGDEAGAWSLYIRRWAPGRPRVEKWPANYRAAVEAVNAPQNAPQTMPNPAQSCPTDTKSP